MKINFFQFNHPLYPFRWFIIICIGVAGFMTYADMTGMRMMNFSDGKQWSSSGGPYHK